MKSILTTLDKFSHDSPTHGPKHCHNSNYIKLNMSSKNLFSDSITLVSSLFDTENEYENEKQPTFEIREQSRWWNRRI